ncbi:MAG: DUF6702 family protein [Pseudomonadota bacterium]
MAAAHQQKEALTRVLFNPRTGNIEVMHRFLLHDAEHAVKAIFDGEADIIGDAGTRDRFAAYVHDRFALTDGDGVALDLVPVGHEIEGKHLWIYAEVAIPSELEALRIRHDALRDLWSDQVNLVNVDRAGETRSALFAGGEAAVEIAFD